MYEQRLTEEYVQDCFHSYLKSSLTQAKAERLLDTELLSSAEGDLMITGPALCLYFAALRCTTSPPSVPLPRRNKSAHNLPTDLSEANCPASFISFLRVWANTVPQIQNLIPEHQHDLARIICNLPPISQPANRSLGGISADLRAVAIEISQRRTFQDRYASDLQAALDAGGGGGATGLKVTASFVPPPVYDESPMGSPGPGSPRKFADKQTLPPLPSESASRPISPRTPSPSLLTHSSPAIEFIRETLYASLGDVLEHSPSLRRLLRDDPTRAYFASVAFAVMDVATGSITPEGSVRGVLGQELTVDECPRELKPFMLELAAIGLSVHESEEDDDREAIEMVSRGEEPNIPRMERVRRIIEEGIGYDTRARTRSMVARGDMAESGRRSVEGRAVALANRINALALGLTRLKSFRDRQKDVFAVLAGIGS